MKAVLFLTILALAIVYVLSTTPECAQCFERCYLDEEGCGSNQVTCTAKMVGKKYRHYFQEDGYWTCLKPSGLANFRRCRDGELFYEAVAECIPKTGYKFTCPCDTCGCKNFTNILLDIYKN